MRVSFSNPIGQWNRRLPSADWLACGEKVLLALLAVQVARLVWAIVTPVGSYGPWEVSQAQIPSLAQRQTLFASFDPFFRTGAPQQAGGGVVTSLSLTLYGIRLNEGSGLGSAIIAGPDGLQNSFAVGDEIMPGVVLKAVAFDHVSIDRGGAEEQLFIDQSGPAPEAGGAPGPSAPVAGQSSAVPATVSAPSPGVVGAAPGPDALKRDIGFAPRTENGRVTGLALQAKGPAFAAAGFQPGDVVTQVNGRPIGSAADLQALQRQLVPGARLSLTVERGATTASVNLTLQGQ